MPPQQRKCPPWRRSLSAQPDSRLNLDPARSATSLNGGSVPDVWDFVAPPLCPSSVLNQRILLFSGGDFSKGVFQVFDRTKGRAGEQRVRRNQRELRKIEKVDLHAVCSLAKQSRDVQVDVDCFSGCFHTHQEDHRSNGLQRQPHAS